MTQSPAPSTPFPEQTKPAAPSVVPGFQTEEEKKAAADKILSSDANAKS
jgi:hypothetical protein